MRRDLSELQSLLVDYESGQATPVVLLRAIVAGLCAVGDDLSEMEADYRKEFAVESEKVGGSD